MENSGDIAKLGRGSFYREKCGNAKTFRQNSTYLENILGRQGKFCSYWNTVESGINWWSGISRGRGVTLRSGLPMG